MKEFIIPNEIKTVLDMLYQSGFSAYIVGGGVRDILMDKIPHDYDVTTSATPEQTLGVFKDFQTYELGRKFGTITVVSGQYHVEITTMRTEKGYADGRRPDEVIFTDSIMEDASRRDFTINAMAYSIKDGFFDGFDGIADLDRGLIRAVGDAERRFTEDGLRIMRALRFAARFGFEIEEKTSQAMEKCAFMLDNIARERIHDELDGFLISKGAVGILDRYFDIFCRIIPQLEGADKSTLLDMIAETLEDNLSKLAALLWQTDKAG
ncbi:MAG: polynucleotide adenylyltransferase, partial [Clostridia bacterium]|nr:polynucleotide adenylyltransferase [Clostridia bacterium]